MRLGCTLLTAMVKQAVGFRVLGQICTVTSPDLDQLLFVGVEEGREWRAVGAVVNMFISNGIAAILGLIGCEVDVQRAVLISVLQQCEGFFASCWRQEGLGAFRCVGFCLQT